eukprot:TRINITY_DN6152_c0_g1_i2.p1 TRINITY_DN6152_c0_g1~~TRINITY_DN6152_c0_g1_i2.p1  ORF type:complete len:375 (-),score=67.04 TRINITY_DN6152_c0_g1_i2:73-1197(-)
MEFRARDTFFPILCLIQVAANVGLDNQVVALIDPLSKINLAPFWALISDPNVEKIVHDGKEEMKILAQHGVEDAKSFFDTQIASGFCGLGKQVGLNALVQEELKVTLDKSCQTSNWTLRPLSAKQIAYAGNDVRYLPLLKGCLQPRLVQAGLEKCFREECDNLCGAKMDPRTLYKRIEKHQNMSAKQLTILRDLVIFREEAAMRGNYPRQWNYSDELLVELARAETNNVQIILQILHKRSKNDDPKIFADLITASLSSPWEIPVKRAPTPTPKKQFNLDFLFAIMESMCYSRGIHPKMVIDRTKFVDFVYPYLCEVVEKDAELDAKIFPDISFFSGWRRELVAEPLVEFMRGSSLQLTFSVKGAEKQEKATEEQ